MKNHASGHRKGGAGYRTPSGFRFSAHAKMRKLQAKWTKKK